jgi:cytochrome P450
VGNELALLEGQLIVATLSQQVEFTLIQPQQIVPEPLITLRPRHGIKAIVRRRFAASGTALRPAADARERV